MIYKSQGSDLGREGQTGHHRVIMQDAWDSEKKFDWIPCVPSTPGELFKKLNYLSGMNGTIKFSGSQVDNPPACIETGRNLYMIACSIVSPHFKM